MSVLENLKPYEVFKYFEDICNIPHGSYNTAKISGYLVDFASAHNLKHIQDDDGNVIIFKGASAGYENSKPVILQGHMDMVCEKDGSRDIDFENDPIEIYIDGDFIKARGTTLGGDDGVALAYALAILADDTLNHPPIEAVFTVDEEVGLLGADSIDLSECKGSILLNLDSEMEGHFLSSCAGGLAAEMSLPVTRAERHGLECVIEVKGLLGGHSGGEIDKDRANAIIIMGRLLKSIASELPIGIETLEGGLKDNAIPRETVCSFLIPEDCLNDLNEIFDRLKNDIINEYRVNDPEMNISIQIGELKTGSCIDTISLQKILFLLRNIPNGVQHMSSVIEGLVETSLNAGIMKLTDNLFELTDSVRSSVTSRKYDLADRLIYLVEFLGGNVNITGDYPAWEYKADSELRDKISEVYEYMYCKKPMFEAIHAGVECGIFAPKIKDMDAVSMGPDMYDIHTPNERLSISSTASFYHFLVQLLAALK